MKRFICLMLSLMLLIGFFVISKSQSGVQVQAEDIKYNVKSYCLMDFDSGKILASCNEKEQYEIASMVKLMTCLLVMEKLEKNEWSLDTKLVASEYAAGMYGSQAFLDAGNEYTIDELLKSVVMASANDSSVVFAESYAGTEDNFVEFMNKKAKEMGLQNTVFSNSTGLPASSQYSCAEDVAIMLKEVSKHELYLKYSSIWMDKLIHKSGRETELVNTNRLVRYFPGCDCGKTGFTDEAGYCLSASAKRNNMRLIAVIMGAKSSEERFTNTASLLNYGFNNFENKQLVFKEKSISTGYKIKGVSEEIEARSSKDLFVLSKRGEEKKNVVVSVELNKKLKSPISTGDCIGKIYLVENGVVLDEADLLSLNNYKKLGYGEIVKKIAGDFRFLSWTLKGKWLSLLFLCKFEFSLIALFLILLYNKNKKEEKLCGAYLTITPVMI